MKSKKFIKVSGFLIYEKFIEETGTLCEESCC